MKITNHRFTVLSLLGVLITAASMHFIDEKVALGIWQITSSQPFLHKHFRDIPNTLPKLVVIGTLIMWSVYYITSLNHGRNVLTQFIQLAATAVPAAYLTKVFLQYAFGRTNTRLWLRVGGAIDFRWFNPVENGGFPSGHSIVFTAFFTAVWLYYPRWRALAVAAVAVLGTSLLLTSYHFTSDIIAGIFCGILITVGLHHFLAQSHQSTQ